MDDQTLIPIFFLHPWHPCHPWFRLFGSTTDDADGAASRVYNGRAAGRRRAEGGCVAGAVVLAAGRTRRRRTVGRKTGVRNKRTCPVLRVPCEKTQDVEGRLFAGTQWATAPVSRRAGADAPYGNGWIARRACLGEVMRGRAEVRVESSLRDGHGARTGYGVTSGSRVTCLRRGVEECQDCESEATSTLQARSCVCGVRVLVLMSVCSWFRVSRWCCWPDAAVCSCVR